MSGSGLDELRSTKYHRIVPDHTMHMARGKEAKAKIKFYGTAFRYVVVNAVE